MTLAVSLDGYSLGTSLSAAVACVSNTGVGLELIGPTGVFHIFSAPIKLLLCVGMVAGRLEIMPLLLMLFPSVWTQK